MTEQRTNFFGGTTLNLDTPILTTQLVAGRTYHISARVNINPIGAYSSQGGETICQLEKLTAAGEVGLQLDIVFGTTPDDGTSVDTLEATVTVTDSYRLGLSCEGTGPAENIVLSELSIPTTS